MLTETVAFIVRYFRCSSMMFDAVTRPSTQSNNEELEKAGKEDSGIIITFALNIIKDQPGLSRVWESILT